MKDDKDFTLTDEKKLECLAESIKEAIPDEIKALVYGRDIPEDMRLPNGMNFEEFKQKMQKDMEKDFEFVKSACGVHHFPLTETDFKSIVYLQKRMQTVLSSEVALKELFCDMHQKAVRNKKQEGAQNVMENMEEQCDGNYIYLKKGDKYRVYTVGELKQFLNEAKVPDDAKLMLGYEGFVHFGITSLCYAKPENQLRVNA